MRRELGAFESALTISDDFAALNVVGVVRLDRAPDAALLRRALDALQQRHAQLKTRLITERGRYFFETGETPPIPLEEVESAGDEGWLAAAEVELNRRIARADGPLMRCLLLRHAGQAAPGELVLTFHHTIMDASSGESLIGELLSLYAALEAGSAPPPRGPVPLPPPAETRFPASYRGARRALSLLPFALRQMGDEIAFRAATRGKRQPPIHTAARSRVLTLALPESLTTSLVRRSREKRITLNSILSAAQLLAVNRLLYGEVAMPMRYFIFSNLRPYLLPPPPEEELGCYVAMSRLTAPVSGEVGMWGLAENIHRRVYESARRGEKFAAALMGRPLMQAITRLKAFRMGATALSYTGPDRVQRRFGSLSVTGVHGFVSNIPLGPEYTALVRLSDGALIWDIVYLDADLDRDAAQAVAREIQVALAAAVG